MGQAGSQEDNLKTWFTDCEGCKGDSPPTHFCKDCRAAYCEECSNIRHASGAFSIHTVKQSIELISGYFALECSECEVESSILNHVYCHGCKAYKCKECDRFFHNSKQNDEFHPRQVYALSTEDAFFRCKGCVTKADVPQNSIAEVWCAECALASGASFGSYCLPCHRERHSMGVYKAHPPPQPLHHDLMLTCSGCGDAKPVSDFSACRPCGTLQCKACDGFAHRPQALQAHRRLTFAGGGRVLSLQEYEEAAVGGGGGAAPAGLGALWDQWQAQWAEAQGASVQWPGWAAPKKEDVPLILTSKLADETEKQQDRLKKMNVNGRRVSLPEAVEELQKRKATIKRSAKKKKPRPTMPEKGKSRFRLLTAFSKKGSGLIKEDDSVSFEEEEEEEVKDHDPMPGDDFEEFMRTLKTKGLVAMKHGRSGNVSKVKLTTNQDGTTLFWCRHKHKGDTAPTLPNQVDFSEVHEVRAAIETDPDFPRYAGTVVLRRSLHPRQANRALSLLWDERTLDLEFPDVEACAWAYQGFTMAAVANHRPGGVSPPPP
mmetsp:Transcript_25765/g.46778  ORF Transcript_25765/g.46778 Transcript_25765/m.46778 type:complete len:544 (+) Transcript_25765:41-1672(+)